jgi:PIN domain nuclease of toxin-antitoxin system
LSRGYLLDTNTVLWWFFGAELLSYNSFEAISDRSIDVYVSAVSAMEIATKFRIGKLNLAAPLAGNFAQITSEEGFKPLPLTSEHGDLAGLFPSQHADPWDRLLAAQAKVEDLALVTNDSKMETFGIKPYW